MKSAFTFVRFKPEMFSDFTKIPAGAIRLYLHLRQRDIKNTGCVWCGYKALAADLGKTTQTITRNLRKLESMGLVRREYSDIGLTTKIYFDVTGTPKKAFARLPSAIIMDPKLTDKEVVLWALYELYSRVTVASEVKQVTLSKETGWHRNTVGLHTKRLVEKGLIIRQDRRNVRMSSLTRTLAATDLYAKEKLKPMYKSSRQMREANLVTGENAPKSALSVNIPQPEPTKKATARTAWNAWQDLMERKWKGYIRPARASGAELGICSNFLAEYDIKNVTKLFDLVISDWYAILEKWPKYAKADPSLYIAMGLRKDLMTQASTGQGFTTRTHRVSKMDEYPEETQAAATETDEIVEETPEIEEPTPEPVLEPTLELPPTPAPKPVTAPEPKPTPEPIQRQAPRPSTPPEAPKKEVKTFTPVTDLTMEDPSLTMGPDIIRRFHEICKVRYPDRPQVYEYAKEVEGLRAIDERVPDLRSLRSVLKFGTLAWKMYEQDYDIIKGQYPTIYMLNIIHKNKTANWNK